MSIILFKRLLLTSNYFTLITMFMIKQHIRAFQRQLKESFHWQEFITPAHCSLLSSGSKSAFRWMLCSRCLWLLALPAARYLLNTHSLFFHIQICFFSPLHLLYFSLSYATAEGRWEKWQWRGRGGGGWVHSDGRRKWGTAQDWKWIGSWWEGGQEWLLWMLVSTREHLPVKDSLLTHAQYESALWRCD